MRNANPCLELGTILRGLPSALYTGHAISDVQTAYRHRFANRLWSKATAAGVAFRANLQRAVSVGAGNRAARRLRGTS